MRRVILGFLFAVLRVSGARADITCTPTQPLGQQNRTRMKHRTPPQQNPGVQLITVTEIVASPPAVGVNSPGSRTSAQPIDPRETSVFTVKGDLWVVNIEPNDCDFHLEVSEVGGSVNSDRVIVEIPQTAPFVPARNALLSGLHAAGVTLHARTTLTHAIRIQVLGFGFYDAWHVSTTNPQRGNHHGSPQVGSLWEIHPVWAIIFPASS
jgi:hypothetical protein